MNYIHNHDDYATEPIRGLPAALPRGEFVLWQGAPSWRVFARQVFHTRAIAVLVGLAATLRVISSMDAGATLGMALGEAGIILAFGIVGLSILSLLAWLVQRTTVYTITNKRIMMRVGVAIQKTFNIPFATMDGAALKMHGNDAGSLSVALKPDTSLAYLILWPHARPWRMGHTQPTLRAIPKAEAVAQLLTDAFTSYVQTNETIARLGSTSDEQEATIKSSKVDHEHRREESSQTKLKDDPHAIPRHLVMMSAGAALFALLAVIFVQWTGADGQRTSEEVVEFSQELRFMPLDDDRIAVVDVASGNVITTVEGNTDGLIRGALRGLGMTRDLSDLDPSAPYQLQRLAGDGVYLSDALTGRSIRLESFGPIETGATADLLQLGRSGE